MAKDEIGPVPPGAVAGATDGQITNAVEWFNRMLKIIQRDATTEDRGRTLKATARADSTAATVADLRADFNDLLAKMRTAGMLDS